LAKDKFEFGKTILTEAEISQKTVIALNYYVIYQAARSIVFNTYRNDVDNHEKLAYKVGNILGDSYEHMISFWISRN